MQQPNGADCGIYLLENARRLSQKEDPKQAKLQPNKLRVFYAEVLVARTLYEDSERRAMCALEEKSFDPKNRTIVRRSKKRKICLDESDIEEERTRNASIDYKRLLGPQITPDLIHQYQQKFQESAFQEKDENVCRDRAERLLHLVLAFGCPDYFVTLKKALQQYRLKKPIELIQEEMPPNHLYKGRLYKLSVGSERLGLISNILQRITRVQLADEINAKRDEFLNEKKEKESALKRALRAMVAEIHPSMQGWESDEDPKKKAAYHEVEENLRRWRTDYTIWSCLRSRFSSLSILLLVPYGIYLSSSTPSISGVALERRPFMTNQALIIGRYQREIPKSARQLFLDALTALRSSLGLYIPTLGNLYDTLINPEKLRSRRFRIEDVHDSAIRAAAPDSDILITAFDLAEEEK